MTPLKTLRQLLALHQQLDAAVDACYGVRKEFESEASRVGWLFGKWGEVTCQEFYKQNKHG
ncbi:MAG: hypothetical protein GC192_11665 [Bacteroidetes bacterium]|nr:hypothetical protein [Bacteroidota bacterium]